VEVNSHVWRPKDWEKITERIFANHRSDMDDMSPIVEETAEAILDELRKDGQYINGAVIHSYGMVLVRTLKRGEKGHMVFIPERGV